MGTITITSFKPQSDGSFGSVDALVAFGSSYNNTGNANTTGETVTAASLGCAQIIGMTSGGDDSGYNFELLGVDSAPATSARIKVYQGAAAAAQVFTGAQSPLNLSSPAFSGTGTTAAGQVITTTDNIPSMGLNQCAGMWLVQTGTATTVPVLILSNTAVSNAPAVLTVQGVAATVAGTYKIVTTIPSGTNAASAAAAGSEVPNGTNLATALASVKLTFRVY